MAIPKWLALLAVAAGYGLASGQRRWPRPRSRSLPRNSARRSPPTRRRPQDVSGQDAPRHGQGHDGPRAVHLSGNGVEVPDRAARAGDARLLYGQDARGGPPRLGRRRGEDGPQGDLRAGPDRLQARRHGSRKATPFPPTRVLTKKGLAAKKAERKCGSLHRPRAVALRFGGPIREGEPGYRAEATSFKLRFGPGKWLGMAVGKSVAWGVGNQNKDHWGVGSGEATFSSDVREDADGAYFIFSMNGTDWESDRVAVLFRLTLPDGRPGLATALVPVEQAP